jgi:hypothetical protein
VSTLTEFNRKLFLKIIMEHKLSVKTAISYTLFDT